MRKKQANAEDKQPAPEDIVRLKPFWGIRPGVYLAVIYSFIILCIFFFVMVLPGLRAPGALLVLTTEPSKIAVRVNGVYMGTSQERISVPRGDHSLEFVLPGFNPQRMEINIRGRILGSRFFPRRYHVEVTLGTDDPAAAFAVSAADYAAWSFGGEPTATWQIPLSLSEGAYRVGPFSLDQAHPQLEQQLEEMLKAGARFAVTRAALRDLVRAKALLDNYGFSPSPASLFNTMADILKFLSENPGSAQWLAGLLPPQSAAVITASRWYQEEAANIQAEESFALPPVGGNFELGGLSFTYFSQGVFVQAEPFPHSVRVNGFMLSNEEVTNAVFQNFLAENPQWRREELETLMEQGLVTGSYLLDETLLSRDNARITQISWFAANAFCQWLNSKLPAAMAGWEVRLPTEAEWEYAAKSIRRWPAHAAARVRNMDGSGGWEWCADYFTQLPFFNACAQAIAAIGSPERSVRGAVAVWQRDTVNLEARGSLPPEASSPFVSFRPVIARISEQR